MESFNLKMNIRELYENWESVLGSAFEKLQAKSQLLAPELAAPEVLQDDILREWLAFNYVCATRFKPDGSPIMGEIGGILPTYYSINERVIAVAEVSVERVIECAEILKSGESAKSKESKIKEITLYLPEQRGDVTVINGNRNIANYDFTSAVARENPLDLLATNLYLLLSADGFNILTHKCLEKQQYVFSVPVNSQIFENLKNVDDDLYNRLESMFPMRGAIIPSQFIAGFHITYNGNKIILNPVIGESEAKEHANYLKKIDMEPFSSEILHLGTSDAHGNFNVFKKLLEVKNS